MIPLFLSKEGVTTGVPVTLEETSKLSQNTTLLIIIVVILILAVLGYLYMQRK